MKEVNKRYVVRNKDGEYQAAYNLALGKEKARSYALDCAKSVNGVVYYSEGEKEQELYRIED